MATSSSKQYNMAVKGSYIDESDGTTSVQTRPVSPIVNSFSAATTANRFIALANDVDIAVKASAGNLLSVIVTNTNAAVRYLQIHNKATAPAGGDTAVLSFTIPAGTATQPAVVELGPAFFTHAGFYLATGISIGISTTAATFTAATTTDHTINGIFV